MKIKNAEGTAVIREKNVITLVNKGGSGSRVLKFNTVREAKAYMHSA